MTLKQTILPAVFLLLATTVHADRRPYLVTYDYYTPETGGSRVGAVDGGIRREGWRYCISLAYRDRVRYDRPPRYGDIPSEQETH